MSKGFQHYIPLWRSRFPRRRRVRWHNAWLQNGYCRDCRYCCGPQDSDVPFYMALLPHQSRPGLSDDFYLFGEKTAFMDGRGCKAATPRGCRLARPLRPVACGMFPFVLANGALYLYKLCPAALFTPLAEFYDIGRNAANWLTSFSLADLEHISLDMSTPVLAEHYISLRISIFR